MFKKLIILGFVSIMMTNIQAGASNHQVSEEQEVLSDDEIELLRSDIEETQDTDGSSEVRKEEIKTAVVAALGGSAVAFLVCYFLWKHGKEEKKFGEYPIINGNLTPDDLLRWQIEGTMMRAAWAAAQAGKYASYEAALAAVKSGALPVPLTMVNQSGKDDEFDTFAKMCQTSGLEQEDFKPWHEGYLVICNG